MKVLALDYGAARTGVAVSDPTGTLARPLRTVERFDERFTTALAGPGSGDDARAAAHLLASYLEWSRNRPG